MTTKDISYDREKEAIRKLREEEAVLKEIVANRKIKLELKANIERLYSSLPWYMRFFR